MNAPDNAAPPIGAWFNEAKFGMMVHYGLTSVPGVHCFQQFNKSIPVTKTGVYIVTSEKMYRVWAGSNDQPYVVSAGVIWPRR